MLESLKSSVPRPAEMKQESYDRTLRARAFDVARYLLPLATNTSLGQIVNARTLETQISRLLSSPYAEIRQLGERLRDAATGAAWNVHGDELSRLQQRDRRPRSCPRCSAPKPLLTREVSTAPTLVKYAAPNDYVIATRRELRQAAAELMNSAAHRAGPSVDLIGGEQSLEIELATTLLYGACHYSYRQIRRHVAALSEARVGEIIALGTRHRGRHDELLREFSCRPGADASTSSWTSAASATCTATAAASRSCRASPMPTATTSLKVSPKRACCSNTSWQCSMHTRPAQSWPQAGLRISNFSRLPAPAGHPHPCPLQNGLCRSPLHRRDPLHRQGHFSYRRIAWEMYQAVRRQHPHSLNTSA